MLVTKMRIFINDGTKKHDCCVIISDGYIDIDKNSVNAQMHLL